MEVKVITTISEAKKLVFGEQYVIQPKGLDYQNPESLIKLAPEIEKLQNAVEESIKKKIKKAEKA
jgi:hypothetical protein